MNERQRGDLPSEIEQVTQSWLLDGRGGGRSTSMAEAVTGVQKDESWYWLHLDYSQPVVQAWMHEQSGLAELSAEALIQTETRPRCVSTDGGLLIFLRGVNLNPGADPEDMVSIRLWVDQQRVLSLGLRRLLSVEDLRDAVRSGRGPCTPGDFLVMLIDLLLDRVASVIDGLYELLDGLEESVITDSSPQQREQLASLRRQAITLRRFLAPQREALNRLSLERTGPLSSEHQLVLREAADRLTRFVEDLDAARERAGVLNESLVSMLTEQTNNRMYILSVIAAVFLPLSFFTGLLGINVGGIPGAENPLGFVLVVIGMVVLGVGLIVYFRWRRWF